MNTLQPFEEMTIGQLKKLTEEYIILATKTELLKVHSQAGVEDKSTSAEDIITQLNKQEVKTNGNN